MQKINSPYNVYALILLVFFLFSTAFADTKESQQQNNVVIDNGDLLYVVIPKEVTSEFNPTERNYFKEKVEVDRHGYIFLPSQGNLSVNGKTPENISKMLTDNLPKYLSKSDKASVNLIEKRHYVQIVGHVNSPGWYNIPESANIQTILARAGGTLEGANLASIVVTREDKGKVQKIPANVKQYLVSGDITILPTLHENDTVFVPLLLSADDVVNSQEEGNIPEVRIFGAVRSPGIYTVDRENGITLLDLLIRAQGETIDANLEEISIMKADGSKQLFNLQRLLQGETTAEETDISQSTAEKTPSPFLFPVIKGGDIVHIPRTVIIDKDASGNIIKEKKTITITGPGSIHRGLVNFKAPMTPFEAISQAGGVSDFADTDDIMIIRRIDGKQQNMPFDYDAALAGKEPDANFELQAADIIYIP